MAISSFKDVFIEQLRGIAILLVLAYHYTSRIPHVVMGSDYAPTLQFSTGKLGVYLFFMLSGFLIAKTVETCSSLGEFYAKRVSRIWPLFIFANFFVFVWAHLIETPIVPEGIKDFDVHGRTIADLIGTTFFLEPLGFNCIDGVHWSILVELKFYIFIGLFAVFFKKRFIDAFVLFSVFLGMLEFSIFLFFGEGSYTIINKILHGLFVAQYLPFFAVGMMLFHRQYNLLTACCFFLCLSQLIEAASLNPDFTVIGTLKFSTVFLAFLFFDHFFIKGKICTFFGKYSYSIYLFHQVVGLSIIMMMTPMIGIDLAIVVATAFVLVLSVSASWLIEWRYRRKVTMLLIKAGSFIGLGRMLFGPVLAEQKEKV